MTSSLKDLFSKESCLMFVATLIGIHILWFLFTICKFRAIWNTHGKPSFFITGFLLFLGSGVIRGGLLTYLGYHIVGSSLVVI